VLTIATIVSIGVSAKQPFNQAREEAIQHAQANTDLETAEDFYWYNGEETYFSMRGNTQEGTEVVVIIQQNGGHIKVLEAEETISEDHARAIVRQEKQLARILEARIGMAASIPSWEVSFKQENGKIGYYVMNLETGEWLRSIENI